MTPEAKVKTKIKALLKRHDIWFFFPFSFGAGTNGIPDIIACVRGRFVAIEAKADAKAKLTVLQVRKREEIIKAGGVWLRVHDDETLGVLETLLQGDC